MISKTSVGVTERAKLFDICKLHTESDANIQYS